MSMAKVAPSSTLDYDTRAEGRDKADTEEAGSPKGTPTASSSRATATDSGQKKRPRRMMVHFTDPKRLRPHPLNTKIYGNEDDPQLQESVQKLGVLSPITALSGSRTIISGHRRWRAARVVGLEKVPVTYVDIQDELEVEELLIESNRQRDKTNEDKAREYKELRRIYDARRERQDEKGAILEEAADPPAKNTFSANKPPNQRAAAAVGLSQPSADKALYVFERLDELEAAGDDEAVQKLRETLNKNISKAYRMAKGEPEPKDRRGRPRKKSNKTQVGKSAQHAGSGDVDDPKAEVDAERDVDAEDMDDLDEHNDVAENVASPGVPGTSKNTRAPSDDEWYTPAHIIDAARETMIHIDLDPASCAAANEMVRAERFFTKESDGLKQSWQSSTLWMNPPFNDGLIESFVEKLFDSVNSGDVSTAIVLTTNSTEAPWCQRLLMQASAICFPSERIHFWRADDRKITGPRSGHMIYYFGEDPETFVIHFEGIGCCVIPRALNGEG